MNIFRRFSRTRRSAIAVIMAVSLAPLMFLIGIAVDYTFLSQDRTQTAFAAEAAATQATRVAAATYAFEVAEGNTNQTNAAKIAIDDANIAGNLWYNAELGSLTRGTTAAPTTNTTYDGGTTGAVVGSQPPNFAATVSDNASYPPIFNPLFGRTSQWAYNSAATATTQFSYAQILMLLDTSNSMLIGARQSDIQMMEEGAVCPPTYMHTGLGSNETLQYRTGSYNDYNFAPGDNTWIGFAPTDNFHALHYNTNNTATGTEPSPSGSPSGSAPYQMNGKCDPGYNISGSPFIPCALACHNTNGPTFTANGNTYPADLYGLARSEGAELRVDVMLSATENAIQDIQTSEAVANQISVGIYQFNADVQPIIRGNTQTGDALPEATTNLPAALTAVQNIDYNHNPAETSIPVYTPDCASYSFPTVENCSGNTNLVLSMQHLVSGTLPTDTGAQPLTAAGSGATSAHPLKFMFLITDGMEGENPANGATDLVTNPNYLYKGVMTTLTDNQAVSDPSVQAGTCTAIKKLGYILYVLYVDYLPVSQSQYYVQPVLSAQTLSEFPSARYLVDVADSEPYVAQGGTSAQITARIAANVPTAEALAQCASAPSDFYSASSDTDIQTALNAMLKSALASTIRLTN